MFFSGSTSLTLTLNGQRKYCGNLLIFLIKFWVLRLIILGCVFLAGSIWRCLVYMTDKGKEGSPSLKSVRNMNLLYVRTFKGCNIYTTGSPNIARQNDAILNKMYCYLMPFNQNLVGSWTWINAEILIKTQKRNRNRISANCRSAAPLRLIVIYYFLL